MSAPVVDLGERRQLRDAELALSALAQRVNRMLLASNRILAERLCMVRLAETMQRYDGILSAARPGAVDAVAAAVAGQVVAGEDPDPMRAFCLVFGVTQTDLSERIEAAIDALPAELDRVQREYGDALLAQPPPPTSE